mmetsp:Transcript_38982/g.112617  ORF Transcript_38982/g.112617 Transcript_38982/m.112617 type:complete len:133 (+) Transcript_38982:90-488(+)
MRRNRLRWIRYLASFMAAAHLFVSPSDCTSLLVRNMIVIRGGFRKWKFLSDSVEVRLSVGISLRATSCCWSLHHLDEMRSPSKEQLVIVRVAVRSFRNNTTKTPAIGLTDETGELCMLKVGWDDLNFEFARL